MIARRNFVVALWIGLALASVRAMAADPSATSFVEAIYAPYKVKDGKGSPLDSDAAVKRYFEPRLATLIIKDRNKAAKRGDVSTLDMDPSIDARIGTSAPSMSQSAIPAPTRRPRPSRSRTWASRPPWCLTSSSSERAGGSPTSTGVASQPCADFSPKNKPPSMCGFVRAPCLPT
jgi:hypothetical protein